MSYSVLLSRSARLPSRAALTLLVAMGAAGATGAACAPVTVSTPGAAADGGGLDAAAIDAATGSDAGGAAPDAEACLPGDVATFHPVYHPPALQPGACSPALIEEFFDDCLGSGRSTGVCSKFRQDNPDCAGCILTPESAAAYGPVVDHGAFVTANVAGCIEVEVEGAAASGDGGGGSEALVCAKAVDALGGCQLAACEANCPVSSTSAASLGQFQSCASSADGSGCSTFAAAAACTQSDSGVDVPAVCVQPDFATFYRAVAPLFCLPPAPLDAGAAAYDAQAGD